MATKSNRSSGSQINQRGITQGNTLVGPRSGLPIDEVVDANGVRRLAVDSSITLSGATINVDLDVADDGVHIGNPVTGTVLLVNPDGSINTNVKVDAKDGDNVAISGHAAPLFYEQASAITTLAYTSIFSFTSINAATKIIKLECTCATTANFRVKIDSTIIKVLRSSPIERNIVFRFEEHRPLLLGKVLTVEAQIERQFQPSYDTFIAMEGYIS